MKVMLPAILSGISSRKDRGYNLKFETRELRGSEASLLLEQAHNEGWLLFSPNELKDTDVPDEKADAMTGQKTQAQRLRGTIYRLWEQKGKKGNFEEYYRSVMESLIDNLKEKLE